MQEEKARRKPRIPMSPEEVYYFRKAKELKELKRIEDFKKTVLYKIVNRANIVLASFLSYCVLSILICCYWQTAVIAEVNCSYGPFDSEIQKRPINEIDIITKTGNRVPVKTANLFQAPQANDVLYLGKDFLFGKTLKVKLAFDNQIFWHIYTYPLFTVSVFALCLGFLVYKINKHLNVNGLLTVFGLFLLASLYFVLV